MTQKNMDKFITALEDSLKNLSSTSEENLSEGVGYIESYNDGVINIKGLHTLKMSEVVEIEGTGSLALVMNLDKDVTSALVLQKSSKITEGLPVKSTGEFLGLNVSEAFLGRVVDPLGNPLDGKDAPKGDKFMRHEDSAPDVMSRKSVHEPMMTGILSIDSMIPIGRGQRELIIGDRQTGKTSIALDAIINQADQDMICVYVSVAQREGKNAQVIETLKKAGAMDYTIVVSAPSSSSAVNQFLAPYAGVAISEYFMQKGKHVLVIYDDLSKHAVAYREMSLLLRRPPGREAYPGDVFFIHSRLLERAAKLNEDNGSGSITALPIIETQANDVSAYIPTNVISITDGQIYLQSDLFNAGIRPAVDPGISVSRVGGSAQTKIIKKLSGSVKLDLAQYYELKAFSQFASDLDDATKARLIRGERVVESLKQRESRPYKLWQQAIVLWSASKGYLDKVERTQVTTKIAELLASVEANESALVKSIMTEQALTDEIAQKMDEVISNFLN